MPASKVAEWKQNRTQKGELFIAICSASLSSGCSFCFPRTWRAAAIQESPVTPLVHTIAANVQTDRAMETMRRAYSTDHWFTFPKFEETALYLKQRLEQSGLEQVEIGGGKADGETQVGFWTMPLAWDVKQARLEMIEPEHSLLCDYQSVPASLGMWSGPTPQGWDHGRNRRYHQDSLDGRERKARSDRQELGRIQAPAGEIWGSGRGEWVQRKSRAARWAAMDQRLGR